MVLTQARKLNLPLQGWSLYPSQLRAAMINAIHKTTDSSKESSAENRGRHMGVFFNSICLKKKFYLKKFKMTSIVLFETLDSFENSFDFDWNRTRVPTLASLQR